jgi:alkanesulfonate monooxygenase SsuD/methylene tetrahydromethanopterin reductase-like flavin-dependent oxidoreductase (luciferase family)
VLDAHGWGDLQPELNRLSKSGDWQAMAAAIDDEVLDAFAVRGSPAEVAAAIHERYGDLVDRVALNPPYPVAPETWSDTLAALGAYQRS